MAHPTSSSSNVTAEKNTNTPLHGVLKFDSIQSLTSYLQHWPLEISKACSVQSESRGTELLHYYHHGTILPGVRTFVTHSLVLANPSAASAAHSPLIPESPSKDDAASTCKPSSTSGRSKRPRGRPRKVLNEASGIQRKRGRPRKHEQTCKKSLSQITVIDLVDQTREVEAFKTLTQADEVEEISELSSDASFGRKLESVLQKPFDVSQLENMLSHVNHRKPIVKLRHTRQGSVPFATNEEGLSYLDHYPDFTEKLSLTEDPEEKLQLLRSFFFWIQHSCMPDSFKPWVTSQALAEADMDCLEITVADCEITAVAISGIEKQSIDGLLHKKSTALRQICPV